jgi:hypothetical protein
MPRPRALAAALLMGAVGGCASYYKVTEPVSGKEFYTKEISRKLGGSAIEFKDAKTGAATTLQNSQVLEIDEKAFQAGLNAKPPVPAPAPTQQ